MTTPNIQNIFDYQRTFAVDTGCFSAPDRYNDDRYISWLEARRDHAAMCLFATAPDVWGNGPETLRRSLPVLPRIRAAGFPAALVLQPGITAQVIPWSEVDAVFVGGVDSWQNSAECQSLVNEALDRELWCHRGRVNSLKRMRETLDRGFHSADGTLLAFGYDRNISVARRMARLHKEPASH